MSGDFSLRPRIIVIGVGGAGCNAVNNMILAKLEGVEFLVANTDAQSLDQSLVDIENRVQLGPNLTKGLGAGSHPDVGEKAAEESKETVLEKLKGSNMVFITAGMGGGTGTGAAPVVAQIAKEAGILTIGVVTKPFDFEGNHRKRSAERGINELQKNVDTLIIIPNQNLFRIADEKTTFADAFKSADEVLYAGVSGITNLMIMPGLINLDFADVKAVMAEMGNAMMGTGHAEGENRAIEAAESAISNPLLDEICLKGAKGVLINITGGNDLTLYDVDAATNRIKDEIEGEANIIFGSTFDERLDGKICVSVVATGIGKPAVEEQKNEPQPLNNNIQEQLGFGMGAGLRKTFGGGNQSFSANNALYSNQPEQNDDSAQENRQEQSVFVSEENSPMNQDLNSEVNYEEAIRPPKPTYKPEKPPYEQQKYRQEQPQHRKAERLSFFERLTGTAKKNNVPNNRRYEEQTETKNSAFDEEASSFEIPAFLKRNSDK